MPNQSVVFWIKLSFKQAFFFFINFFVSFCFFSIIRCFFLDNYFWLDYERFNSLTNKKAEKNYRKSNESCKWKSWKSCSCNLLLPPLSLRLHVSWERPHITSLSLQALATYCVRKWLIASSSSAPKLCAPRMILDWNAGLLAVKVSHTWKPLSPIASSLPRSWQSSSERISSNFEQDNRKCSTVMFSSPSQW